MAALGAAGDAGLKPRRLRRRIGIEVGLATAAVAGCIAAVDGLTAIWPAMAGWSGALVALSFLGLPLLIGAARRIEGDPLGIGRRPLLAAMGLGLLATLLVALPFLPAYDALQTGPLERVRWAGPGLRSYGLELQQPLAKRSGSVNVAEHGLALIVHNGLDRAVRLHPDCRAVVSETTCRPRQLGPGGEGLLTPREALGTRVEEINGGPLTATLLEGGQVASVPVIAHGRDWTWLLWLLLTQLVVIGLPEEAFFRGYVLGRLLCIWPARRTLLGAPFGLAHVVSAALFAAIHLVATPSAHRLLVFFPGLLFAWLASRARTTIAPTVHHALANVMLQAASRIYG